MSTKERNPLFEAVDKRHAEYERVTELELNICKRFSDLLTKYGTHQERPPLPPILGEERGSFTELDCILDEESQDRVKVRKYDFGNNIIVSVFTLRGRESFKLNTFSGTICVQIPDQPAVTDPKVLESFLTLATQIEEVVTPSQETTEA